MSTNSLVNSVQSYLASHLMYADNEWLSGCVEFLTEDSSNNYSERDIQNLAKEQWLLNDLKDICPGSLPANLKNQQKTVLNGRFVLQINAAVDIGTPAYQQYLKLQKVNQENIEATIKFDDKVPSHRMIKLYLTDGTQEVLAIEYKPMRNLSCDITPGCKALLKGPIECRRGVLLLTESSIELLGGEVQEIAVSNSLAGLLFTKLGLPITQESDHNTTISHPRNTNIPEPHTQMPSSRPDDVQPHEPTDQTTRPVARVTSLQVATFNDDDIDIDQLAAIEEQFNDSNKRSETEIRNSRSNTEKQINLRSNNSEVQIGNSSKRTNTETCKRSSTEALLENPSKRQLLENTIQKITPVNTIDDYPQDNDLAFEDDEYLMEMEAKFDAKESKAAKDPLAISSEPFVYIKQINDMPVSQKAGRVFRVKGQIMKLLSKLSVGKDGYSLKCTIVDGTGSLEVEFTSGVLSKLVGFTPQEMSQLKKEMATKPELKQKAVMALQKAKDTLQVLYCIIELTMLDVPKITCLVPFEEAHVYLLKKRQVNRL